MYPYYGTMGSIEGSGAIADRREAETASTEKSRGLMTLLPNWEWTEQKTSFAVDAGTNSMRGDIGGNAYFCWSTHDHQPVWSNALRFKKCLRIPATESM